MSEAGKLKKQRVWLHNGLAGRVAMASNAMRAILEAPTTTTEAKETAWRVSGDLQKLRELLRVRVDQDQEGDKSSTENKDLRQT